jgi:hypothetical protein
MFVERDEAPEIQCDLVRIDFLAKPQDPPSTLGLRIGIAAQSCDPNTDDAIAQQTGESRFVWKPFSQQPLRNPSQKTSDQHILDNTVPSQYAKWNVYVVGRVLAIEIRQTGTNGDAEFTRLIAAVKEKEATDF